MKSRLPIIVMVVPQARGVAVAVPYKLSIIIPVLNEAAIISSALQALRRYLSDAGIVAELILVDGGSIDDTYAFAKPLVDLCLRLADAGRAKQMNWGASHAQGEVLLFLHLDTQLPTAAAQQVFPYLYQSEGGWGFYSVRLSGRQKSLRVIERCMQWRSMLTQVATGDQGLFIHKTLFWQVGGFPSQPLMEDVEMSKRLRRLLPPSPVALPVTTSSRRWESRGIVKTVVLMWSLRLLYFLGVPAKILAKYY